MKKIQFVLVVIALLTFAADGLAQRGRGRGGPPPAMSFFITSVGGGNGAAGVH